MAWRPPTPQAAGRLLAALLLGGALTACPKPAPAPTAEMVAFDYSDALQAVALGSGGGRHGQEVKRSVDLPQRLGEGSNVGRGALGGGEGVEAGVGEHLKSSGKGPTFATDPARRHSPLAPECS